MAGTVLRPLLGSIVDYAGLFPPARLDMKPALERYRSARAGDLQWMLGGFVLPSGRLEEFAAAAEEILPSAAERSPWPVSLIVDVAEEPTEVLGAFRERWRGRAVVGSLEVRPCEVEEIAPFAAQCPRDVSTFFEIALDERLDAALEAVAMGGAQAKVRTGGMQPAAFPSVPALSRFLSAAWRHGVPFKATAGLHHPLRGPQAVSGEEGAPVCWMHGFLNVSLAAAFRAAGSVTDEELVEVLAESRPEAFELGKRGVLWRDRELSIEEIERSRRGFFSSFGSCSFDEPVDDLRALGWLTAPTAGNSRSTAVLA